MSASIVAAFLLGMVAGVFVLLAATGMLLAVRDWREAVREGTPLDGDGIERAKRRETGLLFAGDAPPVCVDTAWCGRQSGKPTGLDANGDAL